MRQIPFAHMTFALHKAMQIAYGTKKACVHAKHVLHMKVNATWKKQVEDDVGIYCVQAFM